MMNFDFLKGVDGFESLYENCTDAEKLAVSMPAQSVFTSRKSAELLAKVIYMAAHHKEMENLSFAEILADPIVRDYVHNRSVMDAFHYIRKSGNRAAHGDSRETAENAVSVLQDLHYVAGESARLLGLIKNYPDFEAKIEAYPDAVDFGKKNIEEDVNRKASEMFVSYVKKFNAQLERDKYVAQQDYDWERYSIEGNVEMHEYLEFKAGPKQSELIEYLQDYLSTLLRLSIERSPEKAEELNLHDPVTLDAKLTIGEKQYSSKNTKDFIFALADELPKADGFTVDLICNGVLREFFCEDSDEEGNGKINMIRKDAAWRTGGGMLDRLESFKRRESFTYHLLVSLPDSGNVIAAVIENGRTKEIRDRFSEDILKRPEAVLDFNGLSIFCEGGKNVREYPELFERLKQLVRDNVYETDLRYCEEVWDPNSDEYIEDCILPSVIIKAKTVAAVAEFLTKMNQVIEPWQDEVHFYADDVNLEESVKNTSDNIFYNIEDFELAVVVCREGKLRLEGTVLGDCFQK